ncbi:thioredoxin domain-containing protein [Streptomyces sp. NBC_00335]|uniref:thioredoxin family protein n=1 Tax=unclassified Streptomyces TaxID=2593676 RepID=UPI002258B576|nr:MULTISPECIES: thioredoxin domain-containing protein [unclassified Streptomyces]MCX5409144.1 thioredoxin domain-containing protein [Streptomyces sp. NBC_00086]
MARRVHQPLEDQEFDFILGMTDGPVLAYFCGSWPKALEPCRAMDTVVAALAQEYGTRLTAVRVDITRCPAQTKRYGVTGAPTAVLITAGEPVATQAGPMTAEEFRVFLDARL